MTLAIVVLGAVFLSGIAFGTITRRPLLTGCIAVGAFVSLLVLQEHDGFVAFAAFSLILLTGLVIESVRETVGLLLGRG
jgi:hypothetical protein